MITSPTGNVRMTGKPAPDALRSIRRHVLAGTVAAFALLGGVGGWAATTEFSGAVIAPGIVVVDSNVKSVQHPTGGVVGTIRVRDGDLVKQGELLMELDATRSRSNLALVTKQLERLSVRQARLMAESQDHERITFPAALMERGADAEIAAAIEGEGALFETRRAARNGQKLQLEERIGQLREEIAGREHQIKSAAEELVIVERDLVGVRKLWKRKLVPASRLAGLERDAVRLNGENARLAADIARSRGQISELRLKLLQIDQDLRSEIANELREVEAERAMLHEKRLVAEDELTRVAIRAPVAGRIHENSVHTVGGVVSGADTLMQIVPDGDALAVRVHVQPQDIDQLYQGQRAMLRMSAFNMRDTPEIEGRIARISADLTTEPKTLQSYYVVWIELEDGQVERLGEVTLLPGMPAESFISTTPRTVLSFVTKPFSDQIMRAFREG